MRIEALVNWPVVPVSLQYVNDSDYDDNDDNDDDDDDDNDSQD